MPGAIGAVREPQTLGSFGHVWSQARIRLRHDSRARHRKSPLRPLRCR